MKTTITLTENEVKDLIIMHLVNCKKMCPPPGANLSDYYNKIIFLEDDIGHFTIEVNLD